MLERETKFDVPPSFQLEELASELAPALQLLPETLQNHTTTYWDTFDLRLARWGMTVRYRSTEGWVVKLASLEKGSYLKRQEIYYPGFPTEVPAEVSTLLRAYLRFDSLMPVLTLEAQRAKQRLADATGTALATLDIDEVTATDGSTARFRELEIELSPGTPEEQLVEFTELLRARGAIPTNGAPKHVRALGARAATAPEIVVPDASPDATIGVIIATALARAAVQFLRHDPGVFLGEDAEDVHQARVATRRLRANLQTFAPLLKNLPIMALVVGLRAIAHALGAVRDLDVLQERLQSHALQAPAHLNQYFAHAHSRLAVHQATVRAALLRVRDDPTFGVPMERLVTELHLLPLTPELNRPAREVAGRFVGRAWRPLLKFVSALGGHPSDAALHEVRILTKRCRYAVEAMAPVLSPSAGDFARELAALQTLLGELHDAVVARERWQHLAQEEVAAELIDHLVAVERHAHKHGRAVWREQWRVVRGHPFVVGEVEQ
ncbi:MAG: CYTH and CHAD domain-containing protein [Chloroflexi bacterium]|nr:CYTH and CHAD domain-containing protein [Chloroflexota bacterium]